MRIFIGLREIAGYYNQLKNAFEEIGIDVTFVNLYKHAFQYGKSDENWLIKICTVTNYYKNTISFKLFPIKLIFYFSHYFLRLILLVWAVKQFDVFIFGYNSTLFYYLDLPLLKLLNKKIIYVFHGSDSRPPYIDGAYIQSNNGKSINECYKDTKKKKRVIKRIEQYADFMINQLPQSYFHERMVIQNLAIGMPFNSNIEYKKRYKDSESVTILHSPSYPEAKGSKEIEMVINELREEGYKIEFIKIEKMTNQTVLENIQNCDFVIDQLYSDHPLAGFATESSYFGKVVIVGGYYSDYIFNDVPDHFRPPSYFIHPDKLKEAIIKLYSDKKFRNDLGNKAQKFVQNNWSPRAVANNYMKLINNDIPAEWLLNPQKMNYIHPTCIDEKKGLAYLHSYIKKYGKKGLFLSDKPQIEKILMKLIEN